MIASEHWFLMTLHSLFVFVLFSSSHYLHLPLLLPFTSSSRYSHLCIHSPMSLSSISPHSTILLFPSHLFFSHSPTLPRSMIQPSIEKDLSEFQQKRLMGLGWMFGDQKLSDTMAPEEVADTVYSTLVPHIKDIM